MTQSRETTKTGHDPLIYRLNESRKHNAKKLDPGTNHIVVPRNHETPTYAEQNHVPSREVQITKRNPTFSKSIRDHALDLRILKLDYRFFSKTGLHKRQSLQSCSHIHSYSIAKQEQLSTKTIKKYTINMTHKNT